MAEGTIDGLVVIDKEPGWTSHDVVARCRRIFGQRRVGHSGTLDPPATGVLLVGLGRATRLLRWLTGLPKTYTAEVVLGATTDTLDDTGTPTGRFDMAGVELSEVARAASSLTGPIMQVPPMVSAVKVGGRRLHELARSGVEVDRRARPVTVERFEVAPTDEPGVFRVEVRCSSGTYVRVLAADLGERLGGGAHLRALRRTAIGSFTSDAARTLEELATAPRDHVLGPAEAMRDFSRMTVDDDVAAAIRHGRPLGPGVLDVRPPPPWVVVDGRGTLLGVYEPGDDGVAVAAAVLAPAGE